MPIPPTAARSCSSAMRVALSQGCCSAARESGTCASSASEGYATSRTCAESGAHESELAGQRQPEAAGIPVATEFIGVLDIGIGQREPLPADLAGESGRIVE